MITQALESELKGKKVKTSSGEATVLGAYVSESAGLVLVVIKDAGNGSAELSTLRAMTGITILP